MDQIKTKIKKGELVENDVLLSDYAVLKMDEEQWNTIDKEYLLKVKKEPFGFQCLTSERQFYMENYPDIVIEKGSIDQLIMMIMTMAALFCSHCP